MSEWTETVRAMLEKSTPGPWECDERVGCISVHPMQIANCICDVVDQVAYWNGFMEDGKWDVKESDSNNAKLIAAAPTLLREACERIEALEVLKEECEFALDIADADLATSTPEAWEDVSNIGGRQYEKLREIISALDAADLPIPEETTVKAEVENAAQK